MANTKNVLAHIAISFLYVFSSFSQHFPSKFELITLQVRRTRRWQTARMWWPSTRSTSGSTASTWAQRWEFARQCENNLFLKVKFWLRYKLDTCMYVSWVSNSIIWLYIIWLTDCVMNMSLWIIFFRNMNKWCWFQKIIKPSGWSDRLLSGDDHPANGRSFHFLLNLLTI